MACSRVIVPEQLRDRVDSEINCSEFVSLSSASKWLVLIRCSKRARWVLSTTEMMILIDGNVALIFTAASMSRGAVCFSSCARLPGNSVSVFCLVFTVLWVGLDTSVIGCPTKRALSVMGKYRSCSSLNMHRILAIFYNV